MKYYTDGYTRDGNPGTSGGYSIVDESGRLITHEIINREITNNEAEILGILGCLKMCKEGDSVSTDSMTSLTWVRCGKSKARPDLHSVLDECQDIMLAKEINLMWEGRDFNKAGHYNDTFDTGRPKFVQEVPKGLKKKMRKRKLSGNQQEIERQQNFLLEINKVIPRN